MRVVLIYALSFLFLVIGSIVLSMRAVARAHKEAVANPFMMRRGMRMIAGTAMFFSSVFLLVVACMLNSPPLFYMSTAVIATLLACRFQAWLSVRGLRFERLTPEKVAVGEIVTIETLVWSDKKIRRPLITLVDMLPGKMAAAERTKALPVAPAYDIPIRSQYRFRPMRRGRFHWTGIQVNGTDALGLVTMTKQYDVPGGEMLVVPTPIPLDLDMPAASGWGIAETESGQGRGSGIEPRGIREYAYGDSMRYIHWASSARSGRLMVKEFETGAYATVAILIQRIEGSDIGQGQNSTLERMCANVAYLADRMLRQGAMVSLPQVEEGTRRSASPHERNQEILVSLAFFEGNHKESTATELLKAANEMPTGSMIYLLLSIQEEDLIGAVKAVTSQGKKVAVLAYDYHEFVTKHDQVSAKSASDQNYIAALESAGAFVVKVSGATK